jgi:hypothetical protein
MSASDECVITFPIVGGIFGVGSLATKLNLLLSAAQISPWHIGRWIDFRHTAIRVRFASAADGEIAKLSIGSSASTATNPSAEPAVSGGSLSVTV